MISFRDFFGELYLNKGGGSLEFQNSQNSAFWALKIHRKTFKQISSILDSEDSILDTSGYCENNTNIAFTCAYLCKGGNPKNKIEIFDGIFHEGGGSQVPLRFFFIFLLKNCVESLPECPTHFALSLSFISCIVQGVPEKSLL